MDKLRRDTNKHSEWYWLNLYDEDGEIGKQAAWEPETQLTKIWSSILYNMVFKREHLSPRAWIASIYSGKSADLQS